MPPTLMIAQLNAKTGRGDEFREWYEHVHVRDVMRMDGAVTAQRYEQEEKSGFDAHGHSRFTHLTVYELDDPESVSLAHTEAAGTERLVFSLAADLSDVSVHYYYPTMHIGGLARRNPQHLAILSEFDGDMQFTSEHAMRAVKDVTQTSAQDEHFISMLSADYRDQHQMFRRKPQASSITLLLALPGGPFSSEKLAGVVDVFAHASRVTLFTSTSDRITRARVLSEGQTSREGDARREALAGTQSPWGKRR